MWSSGAIFVENGLKYANPLAFLVYRYLFSMLILWGIYFWFKSKKKKENQFPRSSKQWILVICTGFLQQVGYQLFFFLALDFNVSPGLLSIILGVQPILTALITKESNTKLQWVGLILGMLGLILVVVHNLTTGSMSTIGIICCSLSVLSITLGTFSQNKISISLIPNMVIQYTISFIIFITFAPFINTLSINLTFSFIISLAWMVLIISIGATMLLYYMINKGNLTKVTSLFYCAPPLTAFMDFLIFGHKMTILTLSGLALIVISLIMINKKNESKPGS